ncbi:stage III sporulation protein AF [Brevibacillus daliensis]|uniref:stage III sporulation protein AF n=1 Tax=Brevibacillus daliensis TaxID=2892995 RepID=UPI001E5267DA|nr:stage III sporulation protein AF [Brevibacillus daliensis]
MEFITIWLRKVILLVLLAAFLDLILPNTKLQSYVKMVMGLIIILTIMQPLFSLMNVKQEELAAKIGIYQDIQEGQKVEAEWQQLSKKLINTQDKQVISYVEDQMRSLLTEKVKLAYGVTLTDLAVSFETEVTGQQKISQVVATISDQTNATSGEASGVRAIQSINPVEPVQITIDDKSATNSNESIAASYTPQHPLQKELVTYIAMEYGVEPEDVKVKVEGVEGSSRE